MVLYLQDVSTLLVMARTLDTFFYVDPGNIGTSEFLLTGEEFRHASKVLRIAESDVIYASDGTGTEYSGEYTGQVNADSGKFRIIEKKSRPNEPETVVILLQAILKGDRFDTLVEKAVEIGVNTIIPLVTERCIVKPSSKRKSRWWRIAKSAMKQSRRSILPEITEAVTLDEAFSALQVKDSKKFVLSAGSKNMLADLLGESLGSERITLLIGPEGDFTDNEIKSAMEHGFIPASLGPRRLRSETAGIMSISILLADN